MTVNSATQQIAELRKNYIRQTGLFPAEIRVSRSMLDRISDEMHHAMRSKSCSDEEWREKVAASACAGELSLFNMRVELYE